MLYLILGFGNVRFLSTYLTDLSDDAGGYTSLFRVVARIYAWVRCLGVSATLGQGLSHFD